jgi:hypothetical protein
MGIDFAFGLVGLVAFLWLVINAIRQFKRDIERD